MEVLNVPTWGGLCASPRHTSPTTTHPRSSFWANGASCGPFIWLLTLFTLRMSLPSNRSMCASRTRGGISSAMRLRCPWCRAALGVGISERLFGIWLHSRSLGEGNWPSHADMQPFSLVEKATFPKMIEGISGGRTTMCRKTLMEGVKLMMRCSRIAQMMQFADVSAVL